jgi:hypothetical protein
MNQLCSKSREPRVFTLSGWSWRRLGVVAGELLRQGEFLGGRRVEREEVVQESKAQEAAPKMDCFYCKKNRPFRKLYWYIYKIIRITTK